MASSFTQRLYDAEQARHVSVDADNNVWVGGYPSELRMFYKLDGATGAILNSFFDARDIGCGGYGGLVDGNGILWSVLARYCVMIRSPGRAFASSNMDTALTSIPTVISGCRIWDGGVSSRSRRMARSFPDSRR